MSGSPPSAPTGVPAPRPEDPAGGASGDKRTLVIAVVVMFSLVLVGVVSGALFNRSACATIDPDPVAAGSAGGSGTVEEVLTAAFADTGEVTRDAMAGALDTLSEQLGPITGIAEVAGASSLGRSDRGVAALGPVTSVLNPQGSEVLARVDVGDGQVVGGGDTLYAVAAVNELTGQIDATVPLDRDLAALTCVNTSLINSPLAFALDAGDGELLLLRIDEDGGEPELELRDAVQGRVWGPPLDIGLAQPGVQGERLTGRLGPEVVVTGLRTIDGDETPVLTAVDRRTGAIIWTVDRAALGERLSASFPQFVEVLAVGEDLALIGIGPDPQLDEVEASAAAEVPTRVVALDPVDGSVRWDASLGPGDVPRDAAVAGTSSWVVVAERDGTVAFQGRDADGEVLRSSGTTGTDGDVAILDDARAIGVARDAVVLLADDDVLVLGSDLVGRDVVSDGTSVTVLFGGRDDGPDGGAIAVTFGG